MTEVIKKTSQAKQSAQKTPSSASCQYVKVHLLFFLLRWGWYQNKPRDWSKRNGAVHCGGASGSLLVASSWTLFSVLPDCVVFPHIWAIHYILNILKVLRKSYQKALHGLKYALCVFNFRGMYLSCVINFTCCAINFRCHDNKITLYFTGDYLNKNT